MKVAVVTGAARGIGRRIAEVLAERGYALALLDVQSCEATLAAVRGTGVEAMEYRDDLAQEGAVIRAVAGVTKRWKRVDVLVNNAGISFIRRAEETELEDFRRVLDVNLVAPFLLARFFGAVMLKQRAGAIVNVASIAGLMGVSDRAAYNASKHGLIGLTRTLAAEWGGRGVRVNAVCPGWVKTDMDAADQARGTYADVDITNRVPMGRFASPEDVARAVAFLADPEQSGFVNGQALAVDGGWTTDASWESLRLGRR